MKGFSRGARYLEKYQHEQLHAVRLHHSLRRRRDIKVAFLSGYQTSRR